MGSIRHMTPSINVKMAVFAPIPNPSDNTTAAVNPGLFPSSRIAYAQSFHMGALHYRL
jgi:hypothetical protein